ncbi:McrB family protein [Neobacillus sp. SAB-20_R2A]|uniref:McrB family protein n=1 Tax=Neobacillus sp. SAB-20_R2A TaxID=3120519 RepID=UPI003C6E3D79
MNKTWNTNLIGVLASEESVQYALRKKAIFKNVQDVLQFYIRIISKTPNSFPSIKLITFFGTDLEKWGFEGNHLEETEGRRAVYRFLEDNLLVFKPQQKIRYDGQEVFDGTNLILIPKSERYHEGVSLTPMPIFSEGEHGMTQEEFELRLQAGEWVGKIAGISHEQKDTPEYILWKTSDSVYTVYGEFSGHHYGEEGFSFTRNKLLKSAPFDEEWLDDCYEVDHTMFVPHEIFTYIDGTIEAAEHLEIPYRKSPYMEETERRLAAAQVLSPDPVITVDRNRMSEAELMQEFIRTTTEQGLLYDKKDLYNFHTAMKSSNLVILAGMSGTGKSKLVQAYARALGLTDDYQMTLVPVRPAWTDDADVIGYADTLNKEYRPGDSGVINALMSAKDNSNKLHIICFDEMNLARVEHYFSQFLSVLEMEAGPNRGLRLYNDDLKSQLKNSSMYPPIIPIGDNVIFVGTVNLDESTYHFSDKVLDRANVITLNVLSFDSLMMLTKEMRETTKPAGGNGTVTLDLFDSYRDKTKDIHMKESELALLWEIHTELQKINKNLGVGPRIVRQIDQYLKNLPNSSCFTREEAFDKQVVQRILTKVRGPEDLLKRFIGMYDPVTENIESSILGDLLDKYDEVSEFYDTRNVLVQKAKELKYNGYTL